MYNLFLDDIRMPYAVGNYIYPVDLRKLYRTEEWIIVRNYKEFTEYVNLYGLPKLVSFDHDLAEIHYDPDTWKEGFKYDEETGLDCAKWLVEYCINHKEKLPEFLIHSMNPVGSKNIKDYLENFKKFQDDERI